MNESGIRPLGHRVLVLPESIEKKTSSGIFLPETTTHKEQMAQIRALVIEVGPGAWQDTTSPEWAKEGDMVLIGKYAGLVYEGKDEKTYRVINDLDLVARVE